MGVCSVLNGVSEMKISQGIFTVTHWKTARSASRRPISAILMIILSFLPNTETARQTDLSKKKSITNRYHCYSDADASDKYLYTKSKNLAFISVRFLLIV
jgi:hypothetical protein